MRYPSEGIRQTVKHKVGKEVWARDMHLGVVGIKKY